ncbi:fungal-specific transcription factor domain-containing protein [Aspergillus karnatakaensis]|uniref:Zn(II)2Cys6 transcription factor n=1 Tax=Aspergillus karnatakaensis TaxID=1810916 RepID=UPI003CCCDCD3
MAESAYPYDTNRVREELKHRRKRRGIRSCFPCRHRKVRCDGDVPCASCVSRNHPDLCKVPTSTGEQGHHEPLRTVISPPQPDIRVSHDVSQLVSEEHSTDAASMIARLEQIEQQISSLKADLTAIHTASSASPTCATTVMEPLSREHNRPSGRHVIEDATGATIFLGSHSDTPLTLGCREAVTSGDSMLHNAMIDQFVPRAYPFTSLWGPEATVREVCETLPDESDIIRYWQAYQSTAYPFYPVLVDVDNFGISIFEFLNNRASSQDQPDQEDEPDPSWLALLFAVLACGVQFTHDPVRERDLRSKVFICSSFHCLRMSNFFNRTNLNQIQAMALLGHCQRNNLDTNSAWILMGATIRLAQSIGLHETSPSLPVTDQLQRGRLWWTLIWQDTFLSFTYDRPPSCFATTSCPIPYISASALSFQECIFRICQIILDSTQLKARATEATNRPSPSNSKSQLEAIWNTAASHLSSKAHCRSLQDHLGRLALGIHLNYAICRVTQGDLDMLNPEPIHTPVAIDCRRRAMQVVECFLELHRFSPIVCRSWAFVHNAVSCAVILHNLQNIQSDDQTDPTSLPRRLVTVLETEARESEWHDADTNVRYFGPYSRALKALKEIYGDTLGPPTQ